MEINLHQQEILSSNVAGPGCMRVLPPGKNKTQKATRASAADLTTLRRALCPYAYLAARRWWWATSRARSTASA